MANNRYAAVDLGATSGRVVTGIFDGKTIELREEHRFPNEPVSAYGTVFWDILNLYQNVLTGLNKAATDEIASVGIDTWGNDFALFDHAGRMLENPVHYRDEMSKTAQQLLYTKLSPETIYRTTGVQHLRLNGLFRLYAMSIHHYSAYEKASTFLMIPDVMTYFLTGEMINEQTNASTTQMLHAQTGDWANQMLESIGLNPGIFLPPIQARHHQFSLLRGVCAGNAKLSVVGTHDTACAVAAVPATEKKFIYISSGTWSLVGTETDSPMISASAMRYNFTNERGIFSTNRLLKNVMGMWILEELRREWAKLGEKTDYDQLINLAEQATPFLRLIDPDATQFLDIGNMSEKVNAFLTQTNQPRASSPGEYARCLFESLALRYKTVIRQISELTGCAYSTVHVVGGGARNDLLNQMIADASGLQVVAGPIEATAMGNLLTQAAVCGELSGLSELRRVSAASSQLRVFEPKNFEQYQLAYHQFLLRMKNDRS